MSGVIIVPRLAHAGFCGIPMPTYPLWHLTASSSASVTTHSNPSKPILTTANYIGKSITKQQTHHFEPEHENFWAMGIWLQPRIRDNKDRSPSIVLPTIHHMLFVTLDPNASTVLSDILIVCSTSLHNMTFPVVWHLSTVCFWYHLMLCLNVGRE